jgi:hypothetical protein
MDPASLLRRIKIYRAHPPKKPERKLSLQKKKMPVVSVQQIIQRTGPGVRAGDKEAAAFANGVCFGGSLEVLELRPTGCIVKN